MMVKMHLFLVLCLFVGVQSFFESDILNFQNDKPCGVEASPNLMHQNPWMVFLEYYQNGEKKYLRCGATLISKRYIVTAAHCVNLELFERLVARLGEYDLSTKRDCLRGVCADDLVRINVATIHVPSNYDGMENDIAVLELEEDAPYTDFIRPICLPTGEASSDVTFSAAGWGEETQRHVYSHIKKIVPLPLWSNENCRHAYRKLKLPQKIICAGGIEGKDTCRGDSGGPLVLNKGRAELWGVTSSGNVHCGMKGSPGIYTSVTDHLEFIESVVKSSQDH